MKGRSFYKDADNTNWPRWFGSLILIIGILTSFSVYNFAHANNIYMVYGTVDYITDSRNFVGGKYPIRFLLDNQEYELSYKYSGRQYANANELLDAISQKLALNSYVEMKVVKCFGNPMVLEIKCDDMVFGDFQAAHQAYKNNAIEMSLLSVAFIFIGIVLLIKSLSYPKGRKRR